MRRFRRRDIRTVRRLAKALAALDTHAGIARPKPPRLLRSTAVPGALTNFR
jgi:hypothetical protein